VHAARKFDLASIRLEQNATDRDFEVVIEANAGDDGLVKFSVKSPDGRVVADFTAPDTTSLGLRQYRFETPEPKSLAGLAAAFPPGNYRFSGVSKRGEEYVSECKFDHSLPAAATIVRPKAGAEGVGAENLSIAWSPVKGLAAYVVVIEQEEMGLHVEARLPATATTFSVPRGFLLPGTEYHLSIGTETSSGNASFVESSFTTADK